MLLPYNKKKEKDFEFLYGEVFSDWEIIDSMGNKNLPVLCPKEFAVDVKSMIQPLQLFIIQCFVERTSNSSPSCHYNRHFIFFSSHVHIV